MGSQGWIFAGPKRDGGLGIKNCELFNMAFVPKWAWKIYSYSSPFWAVVLSIRYGDIRRYLFEPFRQDASAKSSLWGRNVGGVVSHWGVDCSQFCISISCKIRNGSLMDFWHHKWIGLKPLYLTFPSFFEVVTFRSSKIESLGCWNNGYWIYLNICFESLKAQAFA